MIVVDTSAIVAILLREPEAEQFGSLIEESEALVSVGSLIELMAVMTAKHGLTGASDILRFVEAFRLRTVAVTEAQIHLAEDGMARFGKGRGLSPAELNFGDLIAYTLARHVQAPLLFKGNDFSWTDVTPALPS
jgi:ribonuclease VapC